MTSLPHTRLTVSGPDALEFLQGQLSNDLRLLGDCDRLLAAWCSPKGRVLVFPGVTRSGDGYRLLFPSELAPAVRDLIAKYRFRAKIDVDEADASPDDLALAPSQSFDDWRLERLRSGIPEISTEQSGKFTPHMLNLDKLDALSFDKGCYTGQEIVARTAYRGASKRRTHRYTSRAPVAPGDRVSDGERDVGEVLNAVDTDLLAVVPVDKADQPLFVGDIPLTHVPLPYL